MVPGLTLFLLPMVKATEKLFQVFASRLPYAL
jgi:hypothetical protein